MKYDLGLSRGKDRRDHRGFRSVEGRRFGNDWAKVDELVLLELAVLVNTPGFKIGHFKVMFRWNGWGQARAKALPKPEPHLVAQNVASMTAEDGLAFLRVMLEVRPRWRHSVPWWTSLALMERRASGQSAAELVAEFGGSVEAMRRWWAGDRFDPLSGEVPHSLY